MLPRPTSVDNLLQGVTQLADAIERGGDVWQEVGATGMPAFTNSWANAAGGARLAYVRDPFGWVRFKGLASSPAGAGTGNGTAVFTLPLGFRPPAATFLPTRIDSGGGKVGFVSITTAGVVTASADGAAANAVVTSAIFDGLNFRLV